MQISIAEWKVRHNPKRYLGHSRAGDAFPEFLVLWALFPIVFFTFSGVEAAGLHSAVDSAAHDSHRRLSVTHPPRRAAELAAQLARGLRPDF
jgi:hypothetical protein